MKYMFVFIILQRNKCSCITFVRNNKYIAFVITCSSSHMQFYTSSVLQFRNILRPSTLFILFLSVLGFSRSQFLCHISCQRTRFRSIHSCRQNTLIECFPSKATYSTLQYSILSKLTSCWSYSPRDFQHQIFVFIRCSTFILDFIHKLQFCICKLHRFIFCKLHILFYSNKIRILYYSMLFLSLPSYLSRSTHFSTIPYVNVF